MHFLVLNAKLQNVDRVRVGVRRALVVLPCTSFCLDSNSRLKGRCDYSFLDAPTDHGELDCCGDVLRGGLPRQEKRHPGGKLFNGPCCKRILDVAEAASEKHVWKQNSSFVFSQTINK